MNQAYRGCMGKVVLDMSMSLDGSIAGPNDDVEHPLGHGGMRLHDWIFDGKSERSGTSPRTSATGSTEGMHFRYDYDFGDNWRHDVLVERIELLDAEDWVAPR